MSAHRLPEALCEVACPLVKDEAQPEDHHLKYIRSTMVGTPSISIEQAYNETIHFAKTPGKAFNMSRKR